MNTARPQTPLRRLWSKRWVRRMTYLLAGGAAVVQIGGWWLERPATTAWIVRKLDAYVREETGLGLEIKRIRVGLWAGYLQLEDVTWGGDMLRIQRVDLQVDPWSLVSDRPHILNLKLVRPQAHVSEARLKALHFKPHPKTHDATPQVQLDHFAMEQAQILLDEPTYGVPALQLDFSAQGLGQGPNAIRLDLASSQLLVRGPHGIDRGKLEIGADLSEPLVTLRHFSFKVGPNLIRAQGRLEPVRKAADAQVSARLDARHLAPYLHLPLPHPSGLVDVEARMSGPFAGPKWALRIRSKELQPGMPQIAAGSLDLHANGEADRAELRNLTWASPQGQVQAQATWRKKEGLHGNVETHGVDLTTLGAYLRAPQLGIPRFDFRSEFSGSGTPEQWADLTRWTLALRGRARDANGAAGSIDLSLDKGRVEAEVDALRMGDITLEGNATSRLSSKGLAQFAAEGAVDVRVSSVAHTLSAWRIVDLPMDGVAHAEARVGWVPKEGLTLQGKIGVQHPKWELETIDDLAGNVKIEKNQLRVDDLLLHAHGGQASGNLWLTWAPVAKGESQFESCYVATRIPVEAGLRAAGLEDEDIGVVLRGLGSGWARLSGPFKALRLEAGAQLERGSLALLPTEGQSSTFRIAVPAAEGHMDLDIASLRMRLSDLHLAGAPEQLHGTPGSLDLRGDLDMDIPQGLWWGRMEGLMDTASLEWPGPRLTGKVSAGVQGPLTLPFGPLNLPRGWAVLDKGGLELEDISIGGFRGRVDFLGSTLDITLNHKDHPDPLLKLVSRADHGDIVADARLRFLPTAMDTAELSRRLTGGALEDLRLDLEAKGRWNGENELRWQGRFNELVGFFPAFTLGQARKSEVWGDGSGARLDLVLDGHQRGVLGPDGAPLPGASVHLSGTLPFSTHNPMDLKAVGTMELGALKSVADALLDVEEGTLLKELRPEGLGTFDLSARGTYLQPYVDGRLDMESARLRVGELEDLRDLTMHLVFKDRTISILENRPLTGTLNQGRVQAFGDVTWQPGGLDRYAFQGRLTDFQIQDPPGLEGLLARGSIEASLTGDASGGLLKGNITTDALNYQTDIKLTELLYQSALADSGIASIAAPNDPLDAIRLDLDLNMNRPWEVDTNLAKLEGAPEGTFKILGTLAHQTLRGRMAIAPGGRVTNLLPAGDVVLTRGSIDFSDPVNINPRLDLEGEVQVPGYTVTMEIKGTLANLQWNLRSVPSLSKNDIVAVLINPDYAQTIGSGLSTSSQTAVSSGAANASTGLLTTLALAEFQERLRKTLALDRFNVAVRSGTEGASETEVTLGKRFNIFGWQAPFVGSQKRRKDQTTTSLQVEWRFGGFILQLGGSQISNAPISPAGEIRTTWSPKP